MKTYIFSFQNRFSNSSLNLEENLIKLLNSSATFVDKIEIFSCEDEFGFSTALEKNDFDCLFILNKDSAKFDVAQKIKSILNLDFDADGFLVGDKFISLVQNLTADFSEKLIKKLGEFFGVTIGKMTFKLFGISKEDIDKELDQISAVCPNVFFNVIVSSGDGKIDLFYTDKSTKMEVDKAVKEVIFTFKNFIYAEDDFSLYQRFFDAMKLRKRTVCTAESMTGGKIASKIISVEGASEIFYEGLVVYNELAKERRLNVNHATILQEGVVSSAVAYEMAKGLLESGNCDVAITITGYAGSETVKTENSGLCYIGIGVEDKVEVFKYVFEGKRSEVIESASNTAIYLAFKSVIDFD